MAVSVFIADAFGARLRNTVTVSQSDMVNKFTPRLLFLKKKIGLNMDLP